MPPNRFPLICLPTPLHALPRVSEDLGIDLWIKRDDLTGLAMGGNKGRKLEYLIAAALEAGTEVVVTCGALQSNFVRQLGAACSVAGLRCAAVVMDLPYEDAPSTGSRLRSDRGNAVLDELFGVELSVVPDGTWEQLYWKAEQLAVQFENAGAKVYRAPIGGSTALGAYAFYEAGREVIASGMQFDWIVTASSSGSTHTGLAYAFDGSSTKILGISSDPEPELVNDFAVLGAKLARVIDADRQLAPEEFLLNVEFVGPGYGTPSDAGDEAIRYLARREGILLDPIYSGKAFAGLMALARQQKLTGRVLFWHTGGLPTLFAR